MGKYLVSFGMTSMDLFGREAKRSISRSSISREYVASDDVEAVRISKELALEVIAKLETDYKGPVTVFIGSIVSSRGVVELNPQEEVIYSVRK